MLALADIRRSIHDDHASSRPLSAGYEEIGVAGELAFEDWSGCPMDRTVRPAGDTCDFTIAGHTIDVKTARKAYNLIIEEGRVDQDIYVLAQFETPDGIRFLGWHWGVVMAKQPVRTFGHGIRNHFMAAAELRTMADLREGLEPNG
tara:strand:- start:180 stop:617 length:438 start_codon:yes stop_codon:yes gene_type:complete